MKKMKSMLLMLGILAVAASAWAADTAPAPGTTKATANAAAPGKAALDKKALANIKYNAPSKEAPGQPASKHVIGGPATGTTCAYPCAVMHCPPPGGTNQCCTTTYPYKPC